MLKLSILGLFLTFLSYTTCRTDPSCLNFNLSLSQVIENEGFHREIKWMLEAPLKTTKECQIVLLLEVPAGTAFVNPDEINELSRSKILFAYIDAFVDVEQPLHDAKPHNVYVYLKNKTRSSPESDIFEVSLPVHLRYQKAQVKGGYGIVTFSKPQVLVKCSASSKITKHCTNLDQKNAKCGFVTKDTCIWSSVPYKSYFDNVDLYVPLGDVTNFPVVAIVTLLLGCAGCIYLLSILRTK